MRIIAHRGASAAKRENTVEAFRAARALGADAVELDARRCADGAVVVHHDPAVPGLGPIAGLGAARLPSWLPSLGEALDACAGMGVNVELKDLPGEPGFDPASPLAAAAVEVVAARGLDEAVVVSSFFLPAYDAVRARSPGLATAWLTPSRFDHDAALATTADGGHAAWHPHESAVTPERVAAAHARGLAVHAWTTDDPDRIRFLAAAGCDGVVTNAPDVTRSVLAEASFVSELDRAALRAALNPSTGAVHRLRRRRAGGSTGAFWGLRPQTPGRGTSWWRRP